MDALGSIGRSSPGTTVALPGSPLKRLSAMPRSGAAIFRSIAQTVGTVAGGVASVAGGTQLPSELMGLLQQQMELQMQMQIVSSLSNTERTRHEMVMTPIRNLRIG